MSFKPNYETVYNKIIEDIIDEEDLNYKENSIHEINLDNIWIYSDSLNKPRDDSSKNPKNKLKIIKL